MSARSVRLECIVAMIGSFTIIQSNTYYKGAQGGVYIHSYGNSRTSSFLSSAERYMIY
jgi:hypothetical protein